jgi:hypothetical protein
VPTYTYRFAYRRVVPVWKFWVKRKFQVYKTPNQNYICGMFTETNAAYFASTLNMLGSQE